MFSLTSLFFVWETPLICKQYNFVPQEQKLISAAIVIGIEGTALAQSHSLKLVLDHDVLARSFIASSDIQLSSHFDEGVSRVYMGNAVLLTIEQIDSQSIRKRVKN